MTSVGVALIFLVVAPGGSPFVRWVLAQPPGCRKVNRFPRIPIPFI